MLSFTAPSSTDNLIPCIFRLLVTPTTMTLSCSSKRTRAGLFLTIS